MFRSQRIFLFGSVVVLLFAGFGCDQNAPPPPSRTDGVSGGELVFEDTFDGQDVDARWSSTSSVWRLEEGAMVVAGARNAALWLNFPLPERVRVEFDAIADSEDGDIKFEIFGDGQTHESGYIAIYGGWSNQTTCIARLDEHGSDRLDAPEHQTIVPGQTYQLTAVRTDNQFRWYIDGELVLTRDDQQPLRGESHRFFAFNNWDAPVRFDNLRIYDLGN